MPTAPTLDRHAPSATAPIVFLHIPKTAGQTIHSELSRLVGAPAVSPVRVHTQAAPGAAQMPPGYSLYSGHIDWEALDDLPADRFTFTVLRDPLERIASFYFYLRRQAEALSEAELQSKERTGMRMILTRSADDYFFGGERPWRRFIHDHYDNVYATYFATRKMRGWKDIDPLEPRAFFKQAMAGTRALDRIYSVEDLTALETDIAARTGHDISVSERYVNAGPQAAQERRWPALRAVFEQDKTADRMQRFVRMDRRVMSRLGLPLHDAD